MKYIPPVILALAIVSPAFAEQPESSKVTQTVAHSAQADKDGKRSQSVVLSDGVNWTLVPRSSVIHRGHLQEGRLDGRPVGVLCSWKQFLSLNNAWLAGMEKADYETIANESPSPLDLEPRVIVVIDGGKPIPITE